MLLKCFCFSIFSGLFTAGSLPVFPQTNEQLEILSRLIESEIVEVKRDALGELQRFESESASRVAARVLDDPIPVVRATAVSAVVFMPKSEAFTHISPLLTDRSDFVRREAVNSLAVVAYFESAASLITVLQTDDDSEVRAAAAAALGPVGNTSALDALRKVLESKPKSSRSYLRRSAARSIGQIAELASSVEVSTATPESFLPDKFKTGYGDAPPDRASRDVFSRASIVLSKVLVNRKETNDTRREAAFALGAIGDTASLSALRRFSNDPDYYLAEICREALIKITDR